MQFELSARDLDPAAGPAAGRVCLVPARGRLEVISTATAAQVQEALQDIGYVAKPLEKDVHISGGSTCCGHCG